MGNKDEAMDARYDRAATLLRGMHSTELVKNDILFPHWIENSNCFWYQRSLTSGKQYRLVNARTLSNEVAFDHCALGDALADVVGDLVNSEDLPIGQVVIKPSCSQVIFTAFDKRWLFDPIQGNCIEINAMPDSSVKSPDGRQAVFTRGSNLWLYDSISGEERVLTEDGKSDFAYAAEGEGYGASSDPWGKRAQVIWAPDGKRVFSVIRDTRLVKTLPIVHHVPADGSIRPKVDYRKIAFPGDENVPRYHLFIIDVESGNIEYLQYPPIPVLNNGRGFFNDGMGWWSMDSQRVYFVDQTRDYRTIKVVECDIDAGESRVLFMETGKTNLSLAPSIYDSPVFVPIPESNELIWWSERTGWGHLYLYNLETGVLKKTLTNGEWLVRDVLKFDPIRRELFFQAAGREINRDPYYRELCRVNIDSGDITSIISSDHDHFVASRKSLTVFNAKAFGFDVDTTAGLSPDGEYVVVTRSRADELPQSLLFDRNGHQLLDIEPADISALPKDWRWPEPVKLTAADGKTDIYGLVFRPSDFSPEHSYPILVSGHYLPDTTVVAKGSFHNQVFFGTFYFNEMALAELGFIVVQIDGRGTPYRSKEFMDESYGCIFSASNMDDEITGIRQLAKRFAYMDLDRVGVICSIGGPGAVLALLQYPDFYKVGISTVQHDSRLMPCTMLGDKFEGPSGPFGSRPHPEELVTRLKGKLLLMHGMLDPGNPVACLFRLVEALQLANKDFDMISLPQGHHGCSNYQMRRAWDYLVTHLLNKKPPKEFKLVTSVDMNEIMLDTDPKANAQ